MISHDRYLIERVTDSTWALFGDGNLTNLPGGIEEYLSRRAAMAEAEESGVLNLGMANEPAAAPAEAPGISAQERHRIKKEMNAIERKMGKLDQQMDKLNQQLADAAEAMDTAKLTELDTKLRGVQEEHGELEMQWLELGEEIEG